MDFGVTSVTCVEPPLRTAPRLFGVSEPPLSLFPYESEQWTSLFNHYSWCGELEAAQRSMFWHRRRADQEKRTRLPDGTEPAEERIDGARPRDFE